MTTPNQPPELLGKVPFSITARVAMQLGRESISNSIVAILELVKNAYDADAERVTIRFLNLESADPLLIIEDDGVGMSRNDLIHNWLKIGTQSKKLSPVSTQKKRIVTGEKGLGRLGLDRLCESTILRSYKSTASKGIELRLNWSKYQKHSNSSLESIKHELYRIQKQAIDPITKTVVPYSHGTQIILLNLKDQWGKEQIEVLKQELTLLISPFAGINDFKIEIDTRGLYPECEGIISSSHILEAAQWHVTGAINDDPENSVSFEMTSEHFSKTYSDPPKPWKDRYSDRGHFARSGPLRFEFYFFPREKTELKDLSLTESQVKAFLNSNQGIRIYRDGFRVKPYGQPNGEGDWLNLSYRRTQSPAGIRDDIGTWRVGYNQIVGAVFISRVKNPRLIDQTNREGIVEEDAFFDLGVFARNAIAFFEIKRQEFEKSYAPGDEFEAARAEVQRATEQSSSALAELRVSKDEINNILSDSEISGKQPDIRQLTDLLNRAVSTVTDTVEQVRLKQERFEEAAKAQSERLQHQKDTLGNLASLGILTASFGHETLGSANIVRTNAGLLKRDLETSVALLNIAFQPKVSEELALLMEHSERIETFARFTLANMGRDKRRRKAIHLEQLVPSVFKFFEKPFLDKHIKSQVSVTTGIPTFLGFEIDWESILINLISNAVWAMEDTPAEMRVIRVRAQFADDKISLMMADSGRGLEAGTEDKIFLPTFSTKRNTRGQVFGTGMGLAIVKGFVEDYQGGNITVTSPSDLGGAEFQISLDIPDLKARGKRRKGEGNDDNPQKGLDY